MDRRRFFKQTGLAAGALAMASSPLHADTTKASAGIQAKASGKKKIGLQLYSLRDDMWENPHATLKAVADIGYQSLESFGYNERKFFGDTPVNFKKRLADLGMQMTSSHTAFAVYQEDTVAAWDAVKQNMEDTRTAGSKWITQAGYPGAHYTKLDEVKKLAETFNRIGQLAKSFDLKFAYHNHREEFRAIENQLPYQLYLEQTEKELITFQMDIGHVANEMADYIGYMLAYPGRFAAIHIRDTNVITKKATEFGKGNVRMKDVFDLFAHAGVEDYYVEQEEYDYEPIVSVRKCYEFLEKADYVKW